MEFYTGKVGQDRIVQTIDFGTLDTAAYADNDVLTSGAIAVDAGRFLGFSGVIESINLIEYSSGTLQQPFLRIWVFGSAITPSARNTAKNFTGAQLDLLVTYFDMSNSAWINAGTTTAANQKTVNIPYVCQSTSRTLYIVPEIKQSATFASGATIKGQIVLRRD